MLLPSLPSSRPACATTLVASCRLDSDWSITTASWSERTWSVRKRRACSASRMRVMSWTIVTAPRTTSLSTIGAVESTMVPRVPSNRSMSTTTSAKDSPVLERLRRRPVLGLQPLARLRPERRVGLELVDRSAPASRPPRSCGGRRCAAGPHRPRRRCRDRPERPRRWRAGARPPRPSPPGCDAARRRRGRRPPDPPRLTVLRPDDPGMHVGPDVAPVLVPVADLALERALAQDVLQRLVPAWTPGWRPAAGLSVCCPERLLAGPAEQLLRRLVPEDHAERRRRWRRWRRGRWPGRCACREQRGLRLLARADVREHGEVAGELARLVQHGTAADEDPLRGAGPVLEPDVVVAADALAALPHALCPLGQVLLRRGTRPGCVPASRRACSRAIRRASR